MKDLNAIESLNDKLYNNIIEDVNMFDELFDKKTFLKQYYEGLMHHRSDRFDVWFDPETFPIEYYKDLPEHYPNNFNDWININSYRDDYEEIYKSGNFIKNLAKFHQDKFYFWFNQIPYEFRDQCKYFSKYCSKYFDLWFDGVDNNYKYLTKYNPNEINIWFDKDSYPEDKYHLLAKYCSKYFDLWFDKKLYPKDQYQLLIKHCSDNFDIWYDKDIFYFSDESNLDKKYLMLYCQDKYHIWGKDKNKEQQLLDHFINLAIHKSDDFDNWYNKETFPRELYDFLIVFCQDKFDVWFDKKAFPLTEYYYKVLAKYHSDKIDIWFDEDNIWDMDLINLEKYCWGYISEKYEFGENKNIDYDELLEAISDNTSIESLEFYKYYLTDAEEFLQLM